VTTSNSPEEAQERHSRITSASVAALETVLDILCKPGPSSSPNEGEKEKEKEEKGAVVVEKVSALIVDEVWPKLGSTKDATIRLSLLRLAKTICSRRPRTHLLFLLLLLSLLIV